MSLPFDQVFLARHGQTEWNRACRRQGQLDSPLTPDGLRQAERAAGVVVGKGVDAVFTSPLGRAAATARILAAQLGLVVRTVDGLAEIDHGRFAGLTNAEIDAQYPGQLAQRAAAKYTWRFPGGESYEDADRRAARTLALIAGFGVRRPLVVSHEMIGRMLLANLLLLEPAEALSLDQPHDVIYVVDVRAKQVRKLGGADGDVPLKPSG